MSTKFSIDRSEIREFKSTTLGRDLSLSIQLPDDYENCAGYPVIYALDGHAAFPLLTTICACLWADFFMPKVIVIGIASAGGPGEHARLRRMDYTPTPVAGKPGSGGASRFLACIEQELIPFVDAAYKTDPRDRTLLGWSLGGLFCLYTLFQNPGLFKRYIGASPTPWDEGILFQYEAALAKRTQSLPAHVFLAAGEQESRTMVESMAQMAQTLDSRNYAGLDLTSKVIPGARHCSSAPEAFQSGLRAVFAKQPLELTPDVLAGYTGKYRLEDPEFGEEIYTVTRDGKRLFVETSYDEVRIELLAETSTRFWFSVRGMEITFNAEDGTVPRATVHVAGRDDIALKVED